MHDRRQYAAADPSCSPADIILRTRLTAVDFIADLMNTVSIGFRPATPGVSSLRTRWYVRTGARLYRSTLQGAAMPRPRFVPGTRQNAPSGTFNFVF